MADQSSTPFDQGLFLVHLNRGREHFDQRNFPDAAEQLEEARRLRPEDDTVLNLLGLAYFKQERYKQADSVYRKLIELNPDSYTLHFNLGLVGFKTGDLDDAEAIFLRALELKPDNQKTHFYLGNIYEKKKQYYNAIFQYRKAGANIMVKRVQEKIDNEEPPAQKPDADFALSDRQGALQADSPAAAAPDGANAGAADVPHAELEKINVDHIDRRRFLTALQEGLFVDTPPPKPEAPTTAAKPAAPRKPGVPATPAGSATRAKTASDPDISKKGGATSPRIDARVKRRTPRTSSGNAPIAVTPLPQPIEPARMEQRPSTPSAKKGDETTSPGVSPPPNKPSDTQEEVLSSEERTVIAQAVDDLTASTEQTIPPSTEQTIPPGKRAESDRKTPEPARIRVTEPIVDDQSFDPLSSERVPESASKELFAREDVPDRRRSGGSSDVPPAEEFHPESDPQGVPKLLSWGGADTGPLDRFNARMRRRDDIFRYLENNLIEVNFSGKVFIKQGTIYSYSGNLTFWVKPQREESVPPLVIVSGTGKLLLTDRQRDITVLRIKEEEICIEPSHLLACQETLTPRYAVIENGDSRPDMHVLMIKGSGVLALSVASKPLLITVQKEYPINVSSTSLISWSGNLTPAIVDDEAIAEIMMPGSSTGVNLRLEGEGRVMMEKSSFDE